MQGPRFVAQTIASSCKKHMRSVTLKQLVDLTDVYKSKLDGAEIHKDASRQVDVLEALAVQERECQKLRLTISSEDTPRVEDPFPEEDSSSHPKSRCNTSYGSTQPFHYTRMK